MFDQRNIITAFFLQAAFFSSGCQSTILRAVRSENESTKVIKNVQYSTPDFLPNVKPHHNQMAIRLPPITPVRPVVTVAYNTEFTEDGKKVPPSQNGSIQNGHYDSSSLKTLQPPFWKNNHFAYAPRRLSDSRMTRDQTGVPTLTQNMPSAKPRGKLHSVATQFPADHLPGSVQVSIENHSRIQLPAKQKTTAISQKSLSGKTRHRVSISTGNVSPSLRITDERKNKGKTTQPHSESTQNRIHLKGISTDSNGNSVVACEIDQKETLVATLGSRIKIEDAQGVRTLVVSRITAESVEITDETTNEVIQVR
ncbi:MAG: hypothetical protein MK179_02135 [Pirellulaceae bacterium]|nr:hypothetical protein [Pirellulaceae bacterium]